MEFLNEQELNNDNFRAEIKYSRQLPEMFMTDDINAQTENVTYSILGELRDRYKENEIATFTFQELAELGGLYIRRKTGKIDLYSGKKLDKSMMLVSLALQNFAYYRVTETNDDGTPKSWDIIPLFSKVSVDGTKRQVNLTISTQEIDPYQVDSKGNIIDKPLRVYDLINSADWRTVKHLQYSRELHYGFESKYTKRIYRFISEFRTFPKGAKLRIDDLDKKILKIWRPKEDALDPKTAYDFRDNRKKFLDRAIKELREVKTPEGEQIIKNLGYIFHKTGRSITSIEFTFSPFKEDLPSNEHIRINPSKTKPGNESPFLNDSKRVLDYFNYLSMLKFELNANGLYTHVPNVYNIQFDRDDPQLLQPIHKLLENGIPVDVLFQVAEMKALEWKHDSPQMSSNFRPSVVFGNKFSEYRAFLQVFIEQNSYHFIYEEGADFYIPLNGPWDNR
ncbi:replication initiation protein (plasmid) [Lactococcus lactis]|uniref:replication initiation protein n=1 Tax=Lactococcus lactis TaxID=1358 RepID=UPI003313A7E4